MTPYEALAEAERRCKRAEAAIWRTFTPWGHRRVRREIKAAQQAWIKANVAVFDAQVAAAGFITRDMLRKHVEAMGGTFTKDQA